MLPYSLTFSTDTFLIELSDGRFQLMGERKVEPVLIGHKYLLVSKKIADKFYLIGAERFTTQPAVICDRQKEVEYTDHVKMLVSHHFDPDQINDIDLDGKHFLLMNNMYLFVTPELYIAMMEEFPDFIFTEGLGDFA